MQIVVLGGYGNFGARICRGLAQDAALTVIAAGRRPASAPADFAQRNIQTAAIDIHSANWPLALKALAPAIVIHCAGPFQNQGYEVARTVLACGAHYIDLADGRDFVSGFAAVINADALQANRLAVTGASTVPALSSAVVDAFTARFVRLDGIDTVIAPAQHAPRGIATMAGVMSYAGMPFEVWQDGAWQTMYGWGQVKTVDLGPAGKRLSAVCDVPDLALFPARYAGLRHARFRAALEVGIQHLAISALASLHRRGLVPALSKLAPLMEHAAGFFDFFGSGTGAMTVTMSGLGEAGESLRLRWHVLAPNNHGPEIPCMAALLIARKLATGGLTQVGAVPCMGLVSLAEFVPEFERWAMTTGIEELR